MYGTVMVGRRRGALEEFRRANEDWLELRVPGFVKEETLVADDGQTIVSVVFFESKEAYQRLADDPSQDAFWRERLAPLLDGEPQWFDGTWQDTLVALEPQATGS